VGCGKFVFFSMVRSVSSCIECVVSGDVEEEILVWFVVSFEGEIIVDVGDGRYGRGVYVHSMSSCFEKGARGFMKSARCAVSVEGEGFSVRVLAKFVE
jgi:Predicted nucleic-acid-binding protein implicated in transcription termination